MFYIKGKLNSKFYSIQALGLLKDIVHIFCTYRFCWSETNNHTDYHYIWYSHCTWSTVEPELDTSILDRDGDEVTLAVITLCVVQQQTVPDCLGLEHKDHLCLHEGVRQCLVRDVRRVVEHRVSHGDTCKIWSELITVTVDLALRSPQ